MLDDFVSVSTTVAIVLIWKIERSRKPRGFKRDCRSYTLVAKTHAQTQNDGSKKLVELDRRNQRRAHKPKCDKLSPK